MRRRNLLGGGLAALAARGAVAAPSGETDRVLAIIIPDLPGGQGGTAARILQPHLERALGRPVILDFRPGAGGIVGLTAGSQADSDGAVLTLLSPAVALAPWLSRRMDCVPADFAPIGQISFTPTLLVVGARSPYRRVADLLGAPTNALVAAAPSGWDPPDVAQALFLSRSRLHARELVGLANDEDRLAALERGDLDFAFVQAGRLASPVRALAASGPAREAGVPTLRETGLDVVVGAWRVLAAPAGTPAAVIERLAASVKSVMDTGSVRAEMEAAGLTPSWLSPAECRRAMDAEYRSAGKLLAARGLSVRQEMLGLR